MCRPYDRLRPLNQSDVSTYEAKCLRRVVETHRRYQHSTCFVNKNTRNARRIGYLQQAFPEAIFIHVLRDPRATVASLLNVPWWPDLPIWSHDGLTPTQWESRGGDVTVLAAQLWTREVERILVDKEGLGDDRYIEVRYEDLTQAAHDVIDGILESVRVPWTKAFDSHVDSYEVGNRNTKVDQRLAPAQISAIEREVGSLATRLGY